MEGSEEILARIEGPVCTVTINRPEKLNSLTKTGLELLRDRMLELAGNPDVRCVVITGSGGRAFCSGYDISSISGEEAAVESGHPLAEAMRAVRSYPMAAIAMINGHAFGAGLELAVACDIRVCAAGAKLAMPPARLGVTYHYQGVERFLNLVGPGFAKELFLTGSPVSAEEAARRGLVDHVVKKEELEPFARGLAARISENAPLSVASMKKMMNAWEETRKLSEKDEAAIRSFAARVRESGDSREGKKAFLEKRKPVFRGK